MIPLEQEIIDTIADETGLSSEELGRATRFYDVGIDSLSALEILAALEGKYDIVLDEQELRETSTIGAVVNVVASKIRKKEARS
jgi:acyl carrier protein